MKNPPLQTTFKSTTSDRSISFSTGDESSIILMNVPEFTIRSIRLDVKDNVAMALAILGVGRVTDDIESSAQHLAEQVAARNYSVNKGDLMRTAVTNLRALMIAEELGSVEEKQLTEDAFALYKLAYPESDFTLDEFIHNERNKWVEKLQTLRFNKVTL